MKSVVIWNGQALPKEFIPQITPCVKILCSYRAIKAPAYYIGNCYGSEHNLKPTKRCRCHFWEHDAIARTISFKYFWFYQSLGRIRSQFLQKYQRIFQLIWLQTFLTCSSLFPNAKASGCAKKFERRMRWWYEGFSPTFGLWVVAGAIKSAGISFVPWWTNW